MPFAEDQDMIQTVAPECPGGRRRRELQI